MADDARISTALPRHPKTVKLLRRLKEPGGWSLLCLFLWVAENRPDGNLEGFTGEDVEIAAGWTGEAGAFVSALAEVRFLDGEEGHYRVHDWVEHNPWAANRPKRVEAAKAAAGKRWERKAQSETDASVDNPDASRMQGAYETHTEGNADSMPTSPLLTSPPKDSSSDVCTSDEESNEPKGKRIPSEAATRLAGLLREEILRNKPDYRITQAQQRNWEVTADRMLRLDGRTEEQVACVIRWVQRDEFWMANVLSMDTLREKFDQLEMKRGAVGSSTPAGSKLPASYVPVSERMRAEEHKAAGSLQ